MQHLNEIIQQPKGTLLRKHHVVRLSPMRSETLTLEPEKESKRATASKPKGDENAFTYFPDDSNCALCRMTKPTRARCNTRNLKRADESRHDHQNAFIVQSGHSYWTQSYLRKQKLRQKQHCSSRDSRLNSNIQEESTESTQANLSQRACKKLTIRMLFKPTGWNKRAVRRIKKEQQQRCFEDEFLQNGRIVRRNVNATCGTCTTE